MLSEEIIKKTKGKRPQPKADHPVGENNQTIVQ